jgi:hypothetical protein
MLIMPRQHHSVDDEAMLLLHLLIVLSCAGL